MTMLVHSEVYVNASFHKENLCCQIGTENGQINEAIQLELLC